MSSPAAAVSLREDGRGVVVKVAARPGASSDGVAGVHGDALKLTVTDAPERGKANRALALLLAKTLGVKKSAVSLLSGETSREKAFLVEGASLARVREALDRALA